MLIFGKRKIRIKKHDDFHIQCENCSECKQRFSVYQTYYHLFYIPVFPASQKSIKTVCLNCKDSFNDQKVLHYLSITKTPLYLYSGFILFIALIISLFIVNTNKQNKKIEYINNPKVNDVYLIGSKNEEDNSFYYFMKVKKLNVDTVELIQNVYDYSSFVNKLDEADYFDKNERYKLLRSDLKAYLNNSKIRMVERGYDKKSSFRIEK